MQLEKNNDLQKLTERFDTGILDSDVGQTECLNYFIIDLEKACFLLFF